jgi:NAD(P)-dependent dehydrogenase (short-subunit alcohol dehydrogenase family)
MMTEQTKAVLVTGANKGIGRATVEAILDEGEHTHVFLGSRSVERGEDAKSEIVEERPDAASRVQVIQLDVADDASVDRAADEVAESLVGNALYGIVNNAGVGDRGHPIEKVLGVNAYGPRRVCEAFMPMLDKEDGRVVNVASAAGPNFVNDCDDETKHLLTKDDVTWEEIEAFMDHCVQEAIDQDLKGTGIGDGSTYGLSKACLNAYTIALAREYPDLTINACTPGFIETDMTRPMAERQGKDPREVGMKPPHEGTTAQMHILFGEPEGSGWYFGSDGKRSPMHKYRSPGDPEYTGE